MYQILQIISFTFIYLMPDHLDYINLSLLYGCKNTCTWCMFQKIANNSVSPFCITFCISYIVDTPISVTVSWRRGVWIHVYFLSVLFSLSWICIDTIRNMYSILNSPSLKFTQLQGRRKGLYTKVITTKWIPPLLPFNNL